MHFLSDRSAFALAIPSHCPNISNARKSVEESSYASVRDTIVKRNRTILLVCVLLCNLYFYLMSRAELR
jgi:hypothetical protein